MGGQPKVSVPATQDGTAGGGQRPCRRPYPDRPVSPTRILLSNADGKVYATSDVCSHALAYLSDGFLDGSVVECPLDRARFDVAIGKALSPPADGDIGTYEVTVAGS